MSRQFNAGQLLKMLEVGMSAGRQLEGWQNDSEYHLTTSLFSVFTIGIFEDREIGIDKVVKHLAKESPVFLSACVRAVKRMLDESLWERLGMEMLRNFINNLIYMEVEDQAGTVGFIDSEGLILQLVSDFVIKRIEKYKEGMEGGLDLGLKLLHDNHLVLEDVLPDHLVQIHQTMKKAVLEKSRPVRYKILGFLLLLSKSDLFDKETLMVKLEPGDLTEDDVERDSEPIPYYLEEENDEDEDNDDDGRLSDIQEGQSFGEQIVLKAMIAPGDNFAMKELGTEMTGVVEAPRVEALNASTATVQKGDKTIKMSNAVGVSAEMMPPPSPKDLQTEIPASVDSQLVPVSPMKDLATNDSLEVKVASVSPMKDPATADSLEVNMTPVSPMKDPATADSLEVNMAPVSPMKDFATADSLKDTMAPVSPMKDPSTADSLKDTMAPVSPMKDPSTADSLMDTMAPVSPMKDSSTADSLKDTMAPVSPIKDLFAKVLEDIPESESEEPVKLPKTVAQVQQTITSDEYLSPEDSLTKEVAGDIKTLLGHLVQVSDGYRFTIRTNYTVGRSPRTNIVLDRSNVSREHARFEVNEDKAVVLRVISDKKGVSVNKVVYKKAAVILRDKDEISIGNDTFVWEHNEIVVPPPTKPPTVTTKLAFPQPKPEPFESIDIQHEPIKRRALRQPRRIPAVLVNRDGGVSAFRSTHGILPSLVNVHPAPNNKFLSQAEIIQRHWTESVGETEICSSDSSDF